MQAALVTGGGRRIGAEICRQLAAQGASLAIHCNNSLTEADELAAQINSSGGRAVVIQADLSISENVPNVIHDANVKIGPLDVLVNNASLFEYDDLESLEPETLKQHIDVNTVAPLLLAREFAKQVPDRGGLVVNLLDQKLANPNPDYLSYTTSKHALAGLTFSLAQALAPKVRVCGIAPGLTLPSPHASQTAFEQMHNTTPLARGSTPSDIAEAIIFLTSASAVTGEIIHVDGGEHLAPRDSDSLYGKGV